MTFNDWVEYDISRNVDSETFDTVMYRSYDKLPKDPEIAPLLVCLVSS